MSAPEQTVSRSPWSRAARALRERDSLLALPSALALLVFSVSLGFGFTDHDEHRILLNQPHLFDVGFWSGLGAIFTHLPREEPLLVRDLSWLLNTSLFGFESSFGAHIGNVLLHALNAGGVVVVLRLIGSSRATAVLAACLFAVHPVQVEPVCWVMGRKDLLGAFFGLIYLANWLKRPSAGESGHRLWVVLSSVCLALAILSKLNSVILPGVALACEVFRPSRESRVKTLGVLGIHFAISVALFVWYGRQLAAFGLMSHFGGEDALTHARVLVELLPAQFGAYLAHWVFPWDYSIFYDVPGVGVPTPAALLGLGGLFMALLAMGLYLGWQGRAATGIACAALGLALLPYLNLRYIGVFVANRYLYLASPFAAALTLEALGALARSSRPALRGVAVAGGLWGLVATVQLVRHIPAWSDDAALWRYEMSLSAPSVLSLHMAVRLDVEEAEAGGPGADAAAKRAKSRIEAGIGRPAEMGYVPVEGYRSPLVPNAGRLHHYRGRLALLEGRWADAIPELVLAERMAPGRKSNCFALSDAASMGARETGSREHAGKAMAQWRQCLAKSGSRHDFARLRRQLRELEDAFGPSDRLKDLREAMESKEAAARSAAARKAAAERR